MTAFEPVDPEQLPARLISHALAVRPGDHPARMAVDAPLFLDVSGLTEGMRTAAERAGFRAVVVDARDFYRDAALRLEYGRTDLESFYAGWVDRAALQREVLGPVGRGDGWYLPSLRDRATNRMTRAPRQALATEAVVIVAGTFLLIGGLDFDLSVHVSLGRHTRRRLVPEEDRWTLPAYDRYDLDVDPLGRADIVVRYDDPRHPAVRWPVRSARP